MRAIKLTLLSTALSSLLLVGCGKDDEKTSSDGEKKPDQELAKSKPAPAPVKEDGPKEDGEPKVADPEPKETPVPAVVEADSTPPKVTPQPDKPAPAPAPVPVPVPRPPERESAPLAEGASKELLELARLAERGEAEAQVKLAMKYESGSGVEKNLPEAARLYRKAAVQGRADAQYNLGMMYSSGYGVEKNESEAAKWFSMADATNRAEASRIAPEKKDETPEQP